MPLPNPRPAAAPGGRRERRKVATRREILLASRRLFSTQGIYDSRVEEITRLADIGKGTLYQYFRSKEELVFAVVAEGFADAGRRIEVKTHDATRLEEVVAAIAEAHLEFFQENPDLLKTLHQVRGVLKLDRPEWRPLRGLLDDHIGRLAAALGRGAGGRRLDARRAHDLAEMLFGAISGWLSVRIALEARAAGGPAPARAVEALVAMARSFAAAS